LSTSIDHHLCEAKFTQDELAELGIKADIVPIPPRWFYKQTPLPEKPAIAVYQPMSNKSFYLPEVCKEIADLCPDVTFKFFGDSGAIGKINNVEYIGDVEDMQKRY